MRPGQREVSFCPVAEIGSAPQLGQGSSGPRSSEIVPHSRHISCIQQAGSPMGPRLGASFELYFRAYTSSIPRGSETKTTS